MLVGIETKTVRLELRSQDFSPRTRPLETSGAELIDSSTLDIRHFGLEIRGLRKTCRGSTKMARQRRIDQEQEQRSSTYTSLIDTVRQNLQVHQ